MEWLESQIVRFDKFCNTLDTSQATHNHIPKSCPNEKECDCGMEYRVGYKEDSDKNNNNGNNITYNAHYNGGRDDRDGYTSHRSARHHHLNRYHEIATNVGRTLPVSVIVSDRSSSISSVPSPTSSMSDGISYDAESERGRQEERDEDDVNSVDGDEATNNNNKTYTYKPLPMVRKSQRQFISAEKKDTVYWERRKRNNEAAKKSRESRREKEIEVNRKYHGLEKENTGMRFTIINLQERNVQLENTLKVYKEILIKNNLI